MPKIPSFKNTEFVLNELGFYVVRQKGSHTQFSNGEKTITVAKHGNKEISIGVFLDILRTLDLKKEDFWKIWNK